MAGEFKLPPTPDGTAVRRMVGLLVGLIERAAGGEPPSAEDARQARESAAAFEGLWDVVEEGHARLTEVARTALDNLSRQLERNAELLEAVRVRDEEIARLREAAGPGTPAD